eukprot:6047252-Amphidinium_carterae.1
MQFKLLFTRLQILRLGRIVSQLIDIARLKFQPPPDTFWVRQHHQQMYNERRAASWTLGFD